MAPFKITRVPRWLPAILLVLAIGPGALRASPAAPADGTQEVLDVIEAWNRAFARNDVATYFTYIDDAITVLGPSSPYRSEGVADDREEFEHRLRMGPGRVGYFQELQPHVQRYGDVAVVTYYSRGSYGAEGKERPLYLKETDVLVKKPAGWRIVHIHVSSTETP